MTLTLTKQMKKMPLWPTWLALSAILTGCAGVDEPQKPKPSAAKPVPKKPTAAKNANAAPAPKPTNPTATYALDANPNGFKVESTLPAIQAVPITPPSSEPMASVPALSGSPTVPAANNPALQLAAAPMHFAVEEAAPPSGTSPAVLALIAEAERNRAKGDLDGAVSVLERALRIDSRNPTLTYKLAQVRLKQAKPQQAEELAGKASLLAGSDLSLKRKSWLLIAEARQQQHNPQGAREAKTKAESFLGH